MWPWAASLGLSFLVYKMEAKVTVLIWLSGFTEIMPIKPVSGTSKCYKTRNLLLLIGLFFKMGHKSGYWELQKGVLDLNIQQILKGILKYVYKHFENDI